MNGKWHLIGLDTFSNETYLLSHHGSEPEARAAARDFMRQLELTQPSEASGGQDGIQDRVFILGPGGVHYRYLRVLDA